MLCMTRNWGERIRIVHGGQTLTIQVNESRKGGDRVQIAFDGPRDFRIIRDELPTDDPRAEGVGHGN
jgi:sRNA-binding carbon storage regulator CsrA